MKILLLASAASPHTAAIANHMLQSGVDVRLASMEASTQDFAPGIELTWLPSGEPSGAHGYRQVAAGVQRIVDDWQPDFVNSHYAMSYGRVGSRIRRCPHVASVWGTDILVRPQRSVVANAVARNVLGSARAVFATSEVLARAARELSSTPIFITPFGVEEGIASGSRPEHTDGRDPSRPIILTCAKSLKPHYGHDTAIDVVRELKSRGIFAMLRLAGDGPWRAELAGRASAAGIGDAVQFLGALPRAEIPDFHASGHIGLYPSRHESFGVSLAECLYHGSPVVASDVGGIPEVLASGSHGTLVPPDDVEAFADAIETLVGDRESFERAQVAAAAHGRSFGWGAAIPFFVNAFDTLRATAAELANATFAGPRQIAQARSDGLCVYHCSRTMSQARKDPDLAGVEPLYRGAAQSQPTIAAFGSSDERATALAKIEHYARFGAAPAYALLDCAESPSADATGAEPNSVSEDDFLEALGQRGIARIGNLRSVPSSDDAGADDSESAMSLGRFDALLVPTASLADRLPATCRPKALAMLPGCDPNIGGYRQADRLTALKSGVLRILWAGDIAASTNPLSFLAACSVLAELGIDVQVTVLSSRTGLGLLRGEIEPVFGGPGLRLRVFERSLLHNVARSCNLASCCVQPTPTPNLPHAMIAFEYLSAGLPVVCTAGTEFADVLEGEGAGWASPPGIADTARTLLAILQNPGDYLQAATCAHRFKLQNPWSDRIQRVAELARQLGKAGGPEPAWAGDGGPANQARESIPPHLDEQARSTLERRGGELEAVADAATSRLFPLGHRPDPRGTDGAGVR